MVFAAAASWGTWSLFVRPTGLPSTVTSPLVFAIMAVVALPLGVRDPRPTWDRRAYALVAANSVLDALNLVTFFGAMAQSSVAIAVLTHYCAPIFIAVAAPRVDGVVTRGVRPAAAVALAGLVVVMEPWRALDRSAIVGGALGVASALCYAGNVFVVRRLSAQIGPARAVGWHSVGAALLLAPFAAPQLGAITAPAVGRIAIGAVTIGAVSGIVFNAGLGRIGSARAAVLTFAEPIVAVAVGVLAWHEPLQPLAAVGGALVLGAGVYVARSTRT